MDDCTHHESATQEAEAFECAWTAEACRKSQAKHDRDDDCLLHPWND